MNSFVFLPARAGFAACAALLGLSLLNAPASAQRRRFDQNPFAPPAATTHLPRVRDYHVRHLKLIFDVNAADHSAHGVVTHYLSPLRGPLNSVVLDARDNLKIETCKINGKDAQFTHANNVLTIQSATPLANGREVPVEIAYTMPRTATAGGANGAGGFRWIDPDPERPDRRPGFWTQGETNTNSSWVPCYDAPNDKCTSETHVTVPAEWTVIGNGRETPAVLNTANNTRTYHWTMTQPHSTYLLSLVGGEMDVQKDMWRGVPLYYAVPKGRGNLITGSFGNTPDMLSWFSDNLGVKYPWPKYAQSAVEDFPGGMENVSATTMGAFLTDPRAGNFTMSSLNSHELGHQWFGDLVTCKDWGEVWLNESFATFLEMFYEEHLNGREQYEREVENNIQGYLRTARRFKHALSTNLYSDPDVMFDQGHAYAKGAVVLHTLRRQVGDKAFFASLRHYLQTNKYQPVDTNDLEAAFTQQTRRDMKPFFDQWVRKPGHPVLDMTWTYDEARKEVVATVRQQQDTADGTPIYTTPLTLGILPGRLAGASSPAAPAVKTASLRPATFAASFGPAAYAPASRGAQTGADVLLRQRVLLNQAAQEFHIPVGEKPAVVLLDPDHDMLKEVKDTHWTDAELPVVLRYAPNLVDRRAAAARLAEGGLDAAKTALFVDALQTETTDSGAAALIGSLGATKNESLRPLFRAQAASKQIARREAALLALGRLPLTDDDTRLLRGLALSDTEPYRIVSAAMRGLGGTALTGNLDVFTHQIGQPSLRDELAQTGVEIIAGAKLDAAAPTLIAAAGASHGLFTRVTAVRALEPLASGNPAIHDALLNLLNDAQPRVQQAAIKTLLNRGDKDAVPALKALGSAAKTKAVQDAANAAAGTLEGK